MQILRMPQKALFIHRHWLLSTHFMCLYLLTVCNIRSCTITTNGLIELLFDRLHAAMFLVHILAIKNGIYHSPVAQHTRALWNITDLLPAVDFISRNGHKSFFIMKHSSMIEQQLPHWNAIRLGNSWEDWNPSSK